MSREKSLQLHNVKVNEGENFINDTSHSLELQQEDVATNSEECPKEKEIEKTPISKSKLKKLRKIQRWEETKSMKRMKEKEKKKAKRQANREAGVEVPKKRRTSMASDAASRIRVALDLSFNKLMTEKDQRKVVKQVLRSYSMNRQSLRPLQLHLTNFDESNKELFGNYSTGYRSWDIHLVEENHIAKFDKDELVYLTSDSSNILKELDEKKVYVIGGIVDHNSQKCSKFFYILWNTRTGRRHSIM